MRFVIADLDGRSHAYFDRRVEAREELRAIEREDPESIPDLYVVAYNDHGERVGPQMAAQAVIDQAEGHA